MPGPAVYSGGSGSGSSSGSSSESSSESSYDSTSNGGSADYSGGWPQQKEASSCSSGLYQRRHTRDFRQ